MLSRPRFGIPAALREAALGELKNQDAVSAPVEQTKALPDPDDLPFLEVALCATKHYPARARGDVLVLAPAEAWKRLTAG